MVEVSLNNGEVSKGAFETKVGRKPVSLDEEKLLEKYLETPQHLWSLQDTRVMRWFKHIVDSWKGWTPWSTDKQSCC